MSLAIRLPGSFVFICVAYSVRDCDNSMPFFASPTLHSHVSEKEEIEKHTIDTPINRLNMFLRSRGLWTEQQDKELKDVRCSIQSTV